MPTEILSCAPDQLDASIARAVEIVRKGGLVAFPTETVYGLGANALCGEAVRRIFAVKGRPATNPLIVHLFDFGHLSQVATSLPEETKVLADHFWPGALTLVLPKHQIVPDEVTAGGPTVAVRVPAHPVARRLIGDCGLPLAAPSANRSNQLSPTRAEHVLRDLEGRIDCILDGGPTSGGIESTVLDITTRPARLLRPGLIDPLALERIIGPIERTSAADGGDATTLRSPGQLARHYAPRTMLLCTEDDGVSLARQLVAAGLDVALHTWRDLPTEPPGVRVYSMPADPKLYASRLYESLHLLDAEKHQRIVVALPPREDAWLGVRDRLLRAGS